MSQSLTIRTLIEAADRNAIVNTSTDGTWSLGVLIGVPVLVLVVLGLVIFAAVCFFWDEPGFGAVMVGVTICVLIGTAFGYYPYSAEYHQWREVSGTVQKIDKRLIGSGDSMEDKFVVRFDGSSQQYGCDDTRCAGVEEGDDLALSCKRAWQYTGTDGYDCRFVSTEAGA